MLKLRYHNIRSTFQKFQVQVFGFGDSHLPGGSDSASSTSRWRQESQNSGGGASVGAQPGGFQSVGRPGGMLFVFVCDI